MGVVDMEATTPGGVAMMPVSPKVRMPSAIPTPKPAPGWSTVLGGVIGAGLAWTALVATPVSPLALDGADLLRHVASPADATEQYAAIGRYHWNGVIRDQARLRGARLAVDDLADPRLARDLLEDLLSEVSRGPEAAEAWERLGRLQRDTFGDTAEGARAFQMAFRADRLAPEARERLILAARTHAEAGHHKLADRLWQRLSDRYPDEQARSLIGRAELVLARGHAQDALALYERAIPHASSPAVRQAARLGAATCLERLGNLDEALAEIDGAYLPGSSHERRRQGMESRRAELGTL